MSFKKFNINEKLVTGLEKQNIFEPTKIQEAVINIALENKDVIGQSLTGSGKTLAFLLPMMERIDSESKDLQGLIIAPTHELVVQINQQILDLSRNSGLGIKSATIIGNVNIKRQIKNLKKKPHIVVGTTGRILKLIEMRKLKAHKINTLVIDEADRMLDDNNLKGIKKVLKKTLKDIQVMVFSASITDEALEEANNFMKNPEIIFIDDNEIAPTITHYSLFCERRDKPELLRKLIYALNPKRALVFINKESEIEDVTKKLKYHKYNVLSLHGNAQKQDRKKAMDHLRSGKAQVVIASDLAARGLDIKDVTHIFNLDLSEEAKSYLHRVGRTGRVGKEGFVFSLVTEYEENYLKRLEKKYNIEVHPLVFEKGKLWLETFEE